ncbi:MAG: LLM class flavin-dependent oxidoreductase [Ktedonobacteraceae bacterium]
MHFAINVPNFSAFSDARELAELAYEAEQEGWDGFFIWDHVLYNVGPQGAPPMADPWIELAAIALRTKLIRFGPMVTPLPRRRPWIVAREAVTLDHLSGGRLILGVGLGHDGHREYSGYGEVTDPKVHGAMLDEGLEIIKRMWSGEEFSYEGEHYRLAEVRALPTPLQQPRIPVWVAGFWPNKKPFRRAAQWDGIDPLMRGQAMTPADIREVIAYVQGQQAEKSAFDVVTTGLTNGAERTQNAEMVASYAEAGVTWWQEGFSWHHTIEQVRQRIRQGPPRP